MSRVVDNSDRESIPARIGDRGVEYAEPRPWGVHCIQDIYHPDVQAGLSDGSWVAACAVPYASNLRERLHAAWWVLTGRAHAFLWPKAGDLEGIWKRKAHVVAGRKPLPFEAMKAEGG